MCVSGRSAVGKTVIVSESGLDPLVSYTSRPRRPGEEDGVSYHFRDRDWFESNLDKFAMDLVEFNGDYYGSADDDLEKSEVVIITFDKALEFKALGYPVYLVWVEGPCRTERVGRKRDDDERLEELYLANLGMVDLVIDNMSTVQEAASLLLGAHDFLRNSKK